MSTARDPASMKRTLPLSTSSSSSASSSTRSKRPKTSSATILSSVTTNEVSATTQLERQLTTINAEIQNIQKNLKTQLELENAEIIELGNLNFLYENTTKSIQAQTALAKRYSDDAYAEQSRLTRLNIQLTETEQEITNITEIKNAYETCANTTTGNTELYSTEAETWQFRLTNSNKQLTDIQAKIKLFSRMKESLETRARSAQTTAATLQMTEEQTQAEIEVKKALLQTFKTDREYYIAKLHTLKQQKEQVEKSLLFLNRITPQTLYQSDILHCAKTLLASYLQSKQTSQATFRSIIDGLNILLEEQESNHNLPHWFGKLYQPALLELIGKNPFMIDDALLSLDEEPTLTILTSEAFAKASEKICGAQLNKLIARVAAENEQDTTIVLQKFQELVAHAIVEREAEAQATPDFNVQFTPSL